MTPPSHTSASLLVIGYGNTLRQDDGAGPMVVETIESQALPGVLTLISPQLSPEHAEAVAAARGVVFVDAQAGPASEVKLQEVQPGESTQVTTHAAEPRTVLALARDVFGHAPPAWLLTIPAQGFEFGAGFSPLTRQGIEVAVAMVRDLARRVPHQQIG
jgi:hydrogenase maturation protease